MDPDTLILTTSIELSRCRRGLGLGIGGFVNLSCPGVDLVGLDAVLVAQVRQRCLLDKIPLKDGCLLARTETSSWRTHEILLVWGVILTQTTENFHFQLVQNMVKKSHAAISGT